MPLTAPLLVNTALDRQIELEEKAVQAGIVRYRKLASEAIRRDDGASLKPAERLLSHWFEIYAAYIRDEQKAYRRGDPGKDRTISGPVIDLLPAESLAIIAMHEVVSACMKNNGEVAMTAMSDAVGRAVFAELHMVQASRERRHVTTAIRKGDMDAGDGRKERRRLDFKQRFRRGSVRKINWWARKTLTESWKSQAGQIRVGATLIRILIDCASTDDYDNKFAPAFIRRHAVGNGVKTTMMLKMSDKAMQIINDGHRVRQTLRPRYLPMIVRPYKWVDGAQGGYVSIRTPLISKPTKEQKAAVGKADMNLVYDGLDAVAGTPWQVNHRVRWVQKETWEQGGGILGLPHRGDKAFPPRPNDIDTNDEAKKKWKKEASAVHRENVRRSSERCSIEQMNEIVREFENEDEIYFPHQIDYRGRAYCIPQHLNHQCDDVRRGLLRFAEAKPADTKEAMDAIRVELANCWGKDKVTFDERIQWVHDNERDIRMAAKDPLSTDWWHGADEPWQFLSACFALHDPEHAAHIPIGRDGSCNGLQHYAALGRDSEGAAWVNMAGNDRPSDVYIRVAERTVELLKERDDDSARRLLPLIDRKVVKQPVMTKGGYGATDIGTKWQIEDQLVAKGVPLAEARPLAVYLNKVVLEAIAQTCIGATLIMDWFRRQAKAIAKEGHDVSWTNPLGFPVVQRDRLWKSRKIVTAVGSLMVQDSTDSGAPIDIGRQSRACPPNVIHSIDAATMFLTAIRCRDSDVAFAGVHDKFMTHAATRLYQDRILREVFVEMHERPLLTMLRDEWRAKYPNVEIEDHPSFGNFDLRKVLHSPYFFA